MSGERSSWLTSEAKRASRSMRRCSASTMLLNDVTRPVSSGSVLGGRRVSSRSAAMASAAWLTSPSGREGGPGDPAAQQERDDRREQHRAGQRHGQVVERLLQVVERGQLEVRRADGADGDADRDHRLFAPQLEALDHRLADGRGPLSTSATGRSALGQRGGVAGVPVGLARPLRLRVEQARFAARGALQGVDDPADVDVGVVLLAEALLQDAGVEERAGAGVGLPRRQLAGADDLVDAHAYQ